MTTISIGYPETTATVTSPDRTGPSVVARIARWFRSTYCLMTGGHFKVLHTEPERLALRCVACGHTTPGWELNRTRLAPSYPADRERLRLRRAIAG